MSVLYHLQIHRVAACVPLEEPQINFGWLFLVVGYFVFQVVRPPLIASKSMAEKKVTIALCHAE